MDIRFCNLHIFQIYEKCLQDLKSGVSFGDLSKEYVPKTSEEEPSVMRRMELTKDKLYDKLVNIVQSETEVYPDDEYLGDMLQHLRKKTSQNYGTKSDILDSISSVEQYILDLKSEREFESLIRGSDSEDNDEEDENLCDEIENDYLLAMNSLRTKQ